MLKLNLIHTNFYFIFLYHSHFMLLFFVILKSIDLYHDLIDIIRHGRNIISAVIIFHKCIIYNIFCFSSSYENPFHSLFLFLLFTFQVISNIIFIRSLRYKLRSSHPQNLKYKYDMESLLLESNMLSWHIIFESICEVDSHFFVYSSYHFRFLSLIIW